MIDFEKWNKKHQNLTEKDIQEIAQLYDDLISKTAIIAGSVELSNDVFRFKDFPAIEAQFNKLLKEHSKLFEIILEQKVVKHWNLSEAKNEQFVKNAYKSYKVDKSPIYNRNAEGLSAFRKQKGRKLSSRVWKANSQFKQEIEMYLDLAIKDGVGAKKIASRLKYYVRNAERSQQKYIVKNGVKKYTAHLKVAKPGMGVYKSAYKNALRLARTEINAAYRRADIEKFKDIDFVIGYEIKRSKHPYPCDICDMMKGRYPKNFVWDGNHSNCRCYLVPIQASYKQFINNQRNFIENGVSLNYQQINKINPKLTKWLDKNKGKITDRGIPYFLRHNFEIKKGEIVLK